MTFGKKLKALKFLHLNHEVRIAKKLISYAVPISFGSVVSALAGLIDVVKQ